MEGKKKMQVAVKASATPQIAADVVPGTYIVAPGDVITTQPGFMRGHGTLMDGEDLVACVAGVVETVNKLIRVRPFRSRYFLRLVLESLLTNLSFNGEIGDVVVGRITEVAQKRWRVDVQGRLDAVLPLAAVNLPGGVLRRKSAEDELAMRLFLTEGDAISAEVQQIFQDGALGLHTRNLKYGKLTHGSMVIVAPKLVKRCKNHFHDLPCGVFLVLGTNGYIWVGAPPPIVQVADDEEAAAAAAAAAPAIEVSPAMRERIARVRNVVVALGQEQVSIFDATIVAAFEDSLDFPVKDILKADVVAKICYRACQIGAGLSTASEQ